jgi:DNA-binding transcriptional LysR family regulator
VELRQLVSFQAVVRARSFTAAAERLSYSQSNVTAHIQALEEELQSRLFERLGRHIVLTAAGRRLLVYADRLLALVEEALHEVPEPAAPSVTDVHITLATQMLWHKDKWLSPALRAFADVVRRSTRAGLAVT